MFWMTYHVTLTCYLVIIYAEHIKQEICISLKTHGYNIDMQQVHKITVYDAKTK